MMPSWNGMMLGGTGMRMEALAGMRMEALAGMPMHGLNGLPYIVGGMPGMPMHPMSMGAMSPMGMATSNMFNPAAPVTTAGLEEIIKANQAAVAAMGVQPPKCMNMTPVAPLASKPSTQQFENLPSGVTSSVTAANNDRRATKKMRHAEGHPGSQGQVPVVSPATGPTPY